MADDAFKQCPFCKERIRSEAIKCRYCGEWLERPEPAQPIADEKQSVPPTDSRSPRPPLAEAGERPPPPKKPKKDIPVRTLYRVSAGLLCGCVILIIIGLAMVPWGKLTPERQGELVAKVTIGLGKIVIAAGLLCWAEKRKGYKLLWFSIACALSTLLAAYYFQVGATETRQANKQFRSELSELYSNVLAFAQTGRTNGLPELKSTGNAVNDTVLQYNRELMRDLLPVIAGMRQKLEALQERSVFEDLVLTNSVATKTEVRKRVEAKQVIESAREELSKAIEAFRSRVASQQVSEDARDLVQGMDKSLQHVAPWQEMFNLLQKKQQADLDFLAFIADARNDYELRNGKILFGSVTNRQRYEELCGVITGAVKRIEDFRARRLQTLKAQLEKLK